MTGRLLARAALFASLLATAPAWGQGLIRGTPSDEETITVGAAAISVTATVCRANVGDVTSFRVPALLQVKSNPIFYTLHSATATPDSGDFEAAVGDYLIIEHVTKLRMIRATGADALVKVQCFQ